MNSRANTSTARCAASFLLNFAMSFVLSSVTFYRTFAFLTVYGRYIQGGNSEERYVGEKSVIGLRVTPCAVAMRAWRRSTVIKGRACVSARAMYTVS